MKSNRALFAAIILVLAGVGDALAAQARDAAPRPVGTATVAGRVLRDTTSVARAVVTLDAGDGRGHRQTVTDDDGRFQFDRLPAGRFLLTASKAGWVTSYYGSPRQGRPPGSRVAVDEGARVNIQIPMVPGGVIAGRIVDEAGRPLTRQFPWLLEYRIVGDRRMLTRVRFPNDIGYFEQMTDDRGEFRLFGLPPGTYYLVVNPSIASGARLTTADEVRWATQPGSAIAGAPPPQGAVAGYASLYFPGTPDSGAAQPIVLGPAEVRDGLTFRVGYVTVARLSGTVQRPDGAPAAGVTVMLSARESKVSLEGSGWRATTNPEGRFVIQNVPPGEYRLSTRAPSSLPSVSSRGPVPAAAMPERSLAPAILFDLWGQTDVVMSGQDVENVGITLAPASAITGRIAFDGTTTKAPEDLSGIRLQFMAADALAAAMTGAGTIGALHAGTVQADGTFRVAGLPPDRYIATASWPFMRTGDGTTGWWLTTIHVGGRDIGDAPIEVRANTDVPDVTITFRDRIGAIEGSLSDAAGRPAPEYFVVAFPVERALWTTTSRRTVPPVRPGTDGRFRVNGLLPGDYYLAVVTAIAQDEGTDPAFLEAILPSAIKITIAAGETRRQDLRIGRRP